MDYLFSYPLPLVSLFIFSNENLRLLSDRVDGGVEFLKDERGELEAGLVVVDLVEVGVRLERLLEELRAALLSDLPVDADPLAGGAVEGADLDLGVGSDLLVDVLVGPGPEGELPADLVDEGEGPDPGLAVLVEGRDEVAPGLVDELDDLSDTAHDYLFYSFPSNALN